MNLDMTGLPGNSVIYHAAVHASHKAHHTDYTHQAEYHGTEHDAGS